MDTKTVNQFLKSVRIYHTIPEELRWDCDTCVKDFLTGCQIPGLIAKPIIKALRELNKEQRRRMIAGVLLSGIPSYLNLDAHEISLLQEFVVRESELIPFRTYDYRIKPFPIEGRYYYVNAPVFAFMWVGELGEYRSVKYLCCLQVFRIQADSRTIRPDEEILRQDVAASVLDERGFDGLYESAKVAYREWREALEYDVRRKSEENMRTRLTRPAW